MNGAAAESTALAVMLACVLVCVLVGPAGARRLLTPGRPRRHGDSGAEVRGARGTVVTLCDEAWKRAEQRRVERAPITAAAVAEWCDSLSRALRAGTTLRATLASTVPTDAPLAHRSAGLRRALDRGATVATAVDSLDHRSLDDRRPHASHIELASAVLATAGSVGGPTAASLDRLAAALRLRVADGQERAAHSAQARLSAHVLTVVPLGLLLLLAATDADVRAVLSSGTGVGLLTLGLGLNVGGWLWMRRIIGREAPR